MLDQTTTVAQLKERFKQFVDERDWNQFHTPKNLSMGIACEAAELMEIFQWASPADEKQIFEKKRTEIEHELADVVIYALAFANQNNIDLTSVIENKLKHNAEKYPIEKAKSRATKYTEL